MIGCWEKLYFAFQFNARFLKSGQRRHCKALFIFTRPYAAEGTADLEWIVGAVYSTVRRVHLGVSQRLSSRLRR